MYKKCEGTRPGNRNTALLSSRKTQTSVTVHWRSDGLAGRDARAFAHDSVQRQSDTFVSDCLRTSPLFAGLLPSAIQELCGSVIERAVSSHNIIFREDDPVRFIDVVRSGSAKITQLSPEGAEVILRIACAGCPLDGMGDGSEPVHTTTAWAIRDCSILSWEASVFTAFVNRFPVLQRNATAIVRGRLKMLEQAFCDMSTARAPQRLARILLRLTMYSPCSSPNSLGLSREELAQMIGTTLFTISRLLRDWAERQIVYVSRNGLVIENMEALQQLAEHGDDDRESLPEIA